MDKNSAHVKKIVITGGAGFIGSQLGYRLFQLGWNVVLLDNMWAGYLDNLVIHGKTFGEFVAKDIRDQQLSRIFAGVDTVFHLAGVSALPVCQSEPHFAYDVNTAGTANILEYARQAGVRRVLFSSTSAVYECTPGPVYKETDLVEPDLVYAMTKLAAERICLSYAKNYGMDIIIPRFFNVFGPHQDFRRISPPFTSYLARELVAGNPPVLYNRSDAKRDYVHVDDVINLLLEMIDSKNRYQADVFNIGSGQGFSVPELFEIMKKISGKHIVPVYQDPELFWSSYATLKTDVYPFSKERVKKEVYKEAIADMSRTHQEFHWCAERSIEAGLASVYDYALDSVK